MWGMCTVTRPIARKSYHCDAMVWINEMNICESDVEPGDWELIQKAYNEDCKIIIGRQYIKVEGKWDGDFCVFRARPEIDEICRKYGIYDE